MIVSFFEEYPDEKNLSKISLIDFESNLYLAAKSYNEFSKLKSQIKNKNIKKIIYWPVLEIEEGYWLSPWTKRKALKKVLKEIGNKQVMWDAEFPKKRSLLFTQSHNFLLNKKLIKKYFKKNGKNIYTFEYFFQPNIISFFFRFLGMKFNLKKYKNKIIVGVYTSMHPLEDLFLKDKIGKGIKKYGKNYLVGLGCIDTGIQGDEKLLTKKQLERDLKVCKECDVKEVVLFRLSGLNKEYKKAIRNIIK